MALMKLIFRDISMHFLLERFAVGSYDYAD